MNTGVQDCIRVDGREPSKRVACTERQAAHLLYDGGRVEENAPGDHLAEQAAGRPHVDGGGCRTHGEQQFRRGV